MKDDVNEALDDENYAGLGGIGDGEQLQVFVFVLAKGIVFVLMRGNVFVLLRGIVNGDPVRGQCQMFPANIRRYFAFFISYVNIAMSRLLGQLSDWIQILSTLTQTCYDVTLLRCCVRIPLH